MSTLAPDLDALAAASGFSGVVRVDRPGEPTLARAYGLASRAYRMPNTVDTRYPLASGAKGLTALTVMSLIVDGVLELSTPARAVLGADLPLIAPDVTVEHLLAHRSGIGDYFDEEAGGEITDYALPVPVHTLVSTEDYLAVLGGHPTRFPAGTRFAYCNGGYVVLALIAERVAGKPFADLVRDRVCVPAGMPDTAYLRGDELPPGTATGYLHATGYRTNALHLPVVGSGDGGIYSTAADLAAFWRALFAGAIVPADRVAEMVRPHSDVPSEDLGYGLGFWLRPTGGTVRLEGYDAGVSFRGEHDPDTGTTYTVISNSSDGAWPVARRLAELLDI